MHVRKKWRCHSEWMKVGENEGGEESVTFMAVVDSYRPSVGRRAALSLKSTHSGAQLCLGLKQKFGGCHSCFKGV